MFSNGYKTEMIKKFNLTESLINSSKHYKIPKFVFESRNSINNQCQYHHPSNSLFKLQLQHQPTLLLDKSSILNKLTKTQYSEDKKKKIFNLMTKVQRQKIDLLINRAYQQINNSIRKYNKSVSLPKNKDKIKLKSIPLINKELIIDHVMDQVQKYLPNKNIKNNTFDSNGNDEDDDIFKRKLDKQFIWSHNFLEEKKMENYKKRYKIKFIDTDNKIKINKLKKNKPIKDRSIPAIMRIRTNLFFSTTKNKNEKLAQKNIYNIYNRTNYMMYKDLTK